MRLPKWRRPSYRTAAIAVFVAAGMLFATSYQASEDRNLRVDSADLPTVVKDRMSVLANREENVATLRRQVGALTSQVDDEQVRVLQAQVDAISGPAGLTEIKGAGIEVTLDDAPSNTRAPEGIDPDQLVVHQQDIQAVVNALWASGAQGIMLMDQRVISTSAVRCVGNTLRLQGRVYSPPYRITAVGDQARLQAGLEHSPEVGIYRQYVRAVGLGYQVRTLDSAQVPAFGGSTDLRFAAPAGQSPAFASPPGQPATSPSRKSTP